MNTIRLIVSILLVFVLDLLCVTYTKKQIIAKIRYYNAVCSATIIIMEIIGWELTMTKNKDLKALWYVNNRIKAIFCHFIIYKKGLRLASLLYSLKCCRYLKNKEHLFYFVVTYSKLCDGH